FPPKIYNELNKISKRPTDDSYWKDEEPVIDCGIGSPMSKEQDDSRFITIIPTGIGVPFFKETMAPYFFDEEEVEKEVEAEKNKKENKPKQEEKEPIWQGVDEKIFEEESKQLVDLDNIDK
ncbi:MAG: hypothetical protein PHS54_04805, partial [Clostridia bacterium]|nr:hypothetical protein [Clostridia bacterium]